MQLGVAGSGETFGFQTEKDTSRTHRGHNFRFYSMASGFPASVSSLFGVSILLSISAFKSATRVHLHTWSKSETLWYSGRYRDVQSTCIGFIDFHPKKDDRKLVLWSALSSCVPFPKPSKTVNSVQKEGFRECKLYPTYVLLSTRSMFAILLTRGAEIRFLACLG